MSGVCVAGCGAVSPAGWGLAALRQAVARGEPLATKEFPRPGTSHQLRARAVPPLSSRSAALAHPRLRRVSPITQFAVAAALEAMAQSRDETLGPPGSNPADRKADQRLGVIFCALVGCVNYSRRFYDEALKEPATASPLVFPETVLNAPASHLAAVLGSSAINYTMAGDPATFLQGLALAGQWLGSERVDSCLVVGAEELDWLTLDAVQLFDRKVVVSEGAGALYLKREPGPGMGVELEAVTEAHLFLKGQSRAQAAERARAELLEGNGEQDSRSSLGSTFGGGTDEVEGGKRAVLCDGVQGVPRLDRDEEAAWRDWTGGRISPKAVLGEGYMAAAAWQCVLASAEIASGRCNSAIVNVVGCNQQAIAARFVRTPATV